MVLRHRLELCQGANLAQRDYKTLLHTHATEQMMLNWYPVEESNPLLLCVRQMFYHFYLPGKLAARGRIRTSIGFYTYASFQDWLLTISITRHKLIKWWTRSESNRPQMHCKCISPPWYMRAHLIGICGRNRTPYDKFWRLA